MMLCAFVLAFFLSLTWAAPPTYDAVSTTCPPEPTGNLTCSGKCSGNYTQSPIDCKCYYWYKEAQDLSFSDSQAFCESQNGSLIKITSAAQNNWLAYWLNSMIDYPTSFQVPWIGLTCPGSTKDVCYWIDGSPLTCYDNFDTVEYQSEQVWNGANPNLFLRLPGWAADFGTWLRCDPTPTPNVRAPCKLSVLCMRDSQ